MGVARVGADEERAVRGRREVGFGGWLAVCPAYGITAGGRWRRSLRGVEDTRDLLEAQARH